MENPETNNHQNDNIKFLFLYEYEGRIYTVTKEPTILE